MHTLQSGKHPRTTAACGEEPDGARSQACHKEIDDRRRCTQIKAQVLRHITDDGMSRTAVIRIDKAQAARMRNLAEDRAQERTLARTVGANDRCQLPTVKMQMNMRKDLERPKRDTEVLDLGTAEMRTAFRRPFVMKDMPEHGDPFF